MAWTTSSRRWQVVVESSLRAHCDDAMLALVAIGEASPSAVFDRHAQTCGACRAQATDLAEVVAVGSASLGERAYSQPPAAVWRSLAKDLEPAGSRPDLVVALPSRLVSTDVDADAERRRWPLLVAVVVVLVVLAVMLGWAVLG
ncbi:MAG: hypothetical protein QG597_4576 [Actinomycetota bacterium]|nr:hypothetical protein [Actinomycetota bacterium]